MDQDLHYHRERAMAELDRAINADNHTVASAHFRLSSLHLERAEKLSREPEKAKLFSF